ncbi:MAG: Gfo/Idh/MocA family oxidoreductase [Deltaproteobacteria bacterium]|nr:Gfo/Idh/MocA family oxidoreductase [Deltaproteobacteria bacterium]
MVEQGRQKGIIGRELGIAFVGAGRMGSQRATIASTHPAVRFLAVADIDPARARTVGEKVNADFTSGDNIEVISRPEVNAVVVSTPEHEHTRAVLQALELGKPVLVEKPIALDLGDARKIVAAVRETQGDLFVGYTKRYTRSYILAKEYIAKGCLGQTLGATTRVYNSRAQAFQILKRSPHASPVLDVLTYYVDLVCWFLAGNAPVEVVARGQKGVFRAAGYGADDVTWAIVTFADGAVASLGVDYALPEKYPSLGQSPRMEVLGTEGVILLSEEHKEHIIYTNRGVSHGYVPGHDVNMAFLGTSSSGDYALGDFWGPQADETRGWLDYLSTGRPCILPRAEEGLRTLEVTLAIERAAKTKEPVTLPLL